MRLLLILIFYLITFQLSATHLLGGYISYRMVNDFECEITVRLLTDAAGVDGGQGTIYFGDGISQDGGFDLNVKPVSNDATVTSFVVTHTYPGPGTYKISYREPNYNASTLNITSAGNKPFTINAQLVILPSAGVNSSPVLQLLSNEKGISGRAQRINPAAFDADGDSLSYELITPKAEGYSYPNNADFYNDYSTGNQANNGEPEYSINPVTGEILWNAPGLVGEYVIAYNIIQWRKVEGEWISIGENEVILFDRITDAEPEIIITPPPSQCFNSEADVQGQFSLSGPPDQAYNVFVYSDLEGALINGQSVDPEEVLDFELMEDLQLDVTIPPDLTPEPFKPYKVIVTVRTASEKLMASWGFAVGCNNFPENVIPDPIIEEPEEDECETFLVYPNPTFDESTIEICVPNIRDGIKHTRIVDLSGKVLFEKFISPNSFPIEVDVSNLTPGLYVVHVDEYAGKFIVGN